MRTLKSHPNLSLHEHISQVSIAANHLCQWHSDKVASADVRDIIQKAIQLHDIGKSTEAFQNYINDPSGYVDDPMNKAHTPMSTLFALLLSREEGWDPLGAMMVSSIVFGHHKALPTIERLRDISRGTLAKTLKRQIPTLLTKEIELQCDVDFSRINLGDRPWATIKTYLDETVIPAFNSLSTEDALIFRLKAQFIFSVLLEADKAFLAVKDPQRYLKRKPRNWMSEWVEKRIGTPTNTPVNQIRSSLRVKIKEEIDKIGTSGIFSLTAPTGSGKTLLAATWLLKLREKMARKGNPPKAIIVLPFLSVIDQTVREYEKLLAVGSQEADGSWFLTSHSLSDRRYQQGLEEEDEYFFVDTWRTELVITTYDQFLMSLMDSKVRYQMRFHNLCDSLIVMDEVQSIPCCLWKPLEETLKGLVDVGNSSILLMSATLPSIVSTARALVDDYSEVFKKFNRYVIQFRLEKKLGIDEFCDELVSRRNEWLLNKQRVLITLNTRRSALYVRNRLAENWPENYPKVPILFLSSDVTPRDRRNKIRLIKKNEPCIVVSTQCIEAGIDIDMDLVIRDFAPFDSLIQIAGRCNRNGRGNSPGIVEVVDLCDKNKKAYSEMIYDDIHLQITRQSVIEDRERIEEKEILTLANKFFEILERRKNLGDAYLKNFLEWQELEPVRSLLRGKEIEKYVFLVLKQDARLKRDMAEANSINDRWKRREAWRAIAGRMANVSVSVYAKRDFDPRSIAEEYLGQWILYDDFYSSDRGLILPERSGYEIL